MKVLIVEQNADLGRIWARFLERHGIVAILATGADDACAALDAARGSGGLDALVLQLGLSDGGALRVSDHATFHDTDLPIITVTSSSFFSGGAVFELVPNARTVLSMPPRPDDLVAMIEHYAGARKARSKQDHAGGAMPASDRAMRSAAMPAAGLKRA